MRSPLSRYFAVYFVLLVGLQVCLQGARAEDISKITPVGYVTDLAGTLDPTTKAKLEALGTELQQKTGAQMAIVTVHSLEGESIENYAVDLFKKLGVGGKKNDNGVLLLVSPDERKYRIEVGYGLEPVINDARAGDTGRAMVPELRAKDYNGAIQTGAWQLAKYIADDKGVTLSGQPQRRAAPQSNDTVSSIGVWVFLVVLVLIFMAVKGGRGGGGGGGGWLWFILGMLMNSGGGGGYRGGGGGFGGGGGGYSGGGGFGGFGGGSSGGGGASGSRER